MDNAAIDRRGIFSAWFAGLRKVHTFLLQRNFQAAIIELKVPFNSAPPPWLLIDGVICASYHNAMLRCSCVVLLCSAVMLAFASSCFAQTTPTDQTNLTKILGFENEHGGDKPSG